MLFKKVGAPQETIWRMTAPVGRGRVKRSVAAEKRDEGDERAHEHGRRVRPGSALDAPVEGAEQGEFERCADDDEHHVHAEAALDVAADTQEVIDREQNGGDGREHGVDAHVRDRLRRELPGRAMREMNVGASR